MKKHRKGSMLVNRYTFLNDGGNEGFCITYDAYDSIQKRYVRLSMILEKFKDRLTDIEGLSVQKKDIEIIEDDNKLYVLTEKHLENSEDYAETIESLQRIDQQYEKVKKSTYSKMLSVLEWYERERKNNPELFYSHIDSVNNLADIYYYHYRDIAESSFFSSSSYMNYSYEKTNYIALELYKEAAYRGSAYAQYLVGICYENGYGCIKNFSTAFMYYTVSYKNGNIESCYKIGKFYFYGLGIEQSYDKALYYFREAAENGSAEACVKLAELYSKGEIVDVDDNMVFEYYEKAYNYGNKDVYTKFAKCYTIGKGTNRDIKMSNMLLRKAALNRDSDIFSVVKKTYFIKGVGFINRLKGLWYSILSHWDTIIKFLAFLIIIAIVLSVACWTGTIDYLIAFINEEGRV